MRTLTIAHRRHEPVARYLPCGGTADSCRAGRSAVTTSSSARRLAVIRSASSSSRDLSACAARRHIANTSNATASQATEMTMISVVPIRLGGSRARRRAGAGSSRRRVERAQGRAGAGSISRRCQPEGSHQLRVLRGRALPRPSAPPPPALPGCLPTGSPGWGRAPRPRALAGSCRARSRSARSGPRGGPPCPPRGGRT